MVNAVDTVVQSVGKRVDILPVERSDKSFAQYFVNICGNFISVEFGVLNVFTGDTQTHGVCFK